MSFNEGARLDTSQVQAGGRGRGGIAIGGGAGLLVLIVSLLLGVNPGDVLGGAAPQDAGAPTSSDLERCRTGADANRDVECRVVGTVNSVQDYWAEALPAATGRQYTASKTVIYSGTTQSACGTASNQVGPFYCPLDKKIYIDAAFFDDLTTRFGADDGALAQEYVVAHEYGHHIQELLGLLGRSRQDPQGAQSGAVKVELMADCLAGVWAHHAARTTDAQGNTLLKPLTDADIRSALSAAAAVGDDRIQEKAQGQVNPEAWTHGSAAQRQQWFTTGYKGGDVRRCDTFGDVF